MSQRTTEIISLLEDALLTKRPVKVKTIDKQQLHGVIDAIVPGTVKPYQERSTVTITTKKGPKHIQEYAIAHIMWA
ncbi:MAG: hypothetical protein LKJ69_06865 [Lactobacillus sp.]|jgi:hypothetical protein|nr:hypothetical protein [Lactobacillus sp.]MCI2033111.1 hypothetical protein [Lactobacillus sp.]